MSGQKRTDQLAVGDVLRYGGSDDVASLTVTHVQPIGSQLRLLVFDDGTAERVSNDLLWAVATEDQAAAAKTATVRRNMARALEHLAGIIRSANVAPTKYSIDVGACVNTIAQLETWAAALERPITPGGVDNTIPVIRARDFARFGDVTLDVRVQAQERWPLAEPDGES